MRHKIKRLLNWMIYTAGPHRWPRSSPALVILTYHRVLPASDPRFTREQPGMVVTPETLRNHLHWLREEGFTISRLDDWLARAGRGACHMRECVITFDDGWRDNFEFAFPILRDKAAPFVIFLVADKIGQSDVFWPSKLNRIVAEIARRKIDVASLGDSWLSQLLAGIAIGNVPRPAELDAIIVAAKRQPDAEVWMHVERLQKQLGLAPEDARDMLAREEISEMMASGLMEIGSHSATHLRLLDGVGEDALAAEIAGSKHTLMNMFGSEPQCFCFPNGEFSPQALEFARNHYQASVVTQKGWNGLQTDRHVLRRISMHEDATCSRESFWAKVGALR